MALSGGTTLKPKGEQVIPAGERLIVLTPGGAGYGNPADRDPAAVQRDVQAGLISHECAQVDYGLRFFEDGTFVECGVRAKLEAAQ